MDKPAPQKIARTRPATVHDVGAAVKLWGRRGLLGGAIAGFGLGIAFVSLPTGPNVLAFGTIGTLIVVIVEGAVVAGALSACAAALYGSGVIHGLSVRLDRVPPLFRRARARTWHEADVPLPDFPIKLAHPIPSADPVVTASDPQARLNTIDGRENDNTGP